jgi:hypothetical protein
MSTPWCSIAQASVVRAQYGYDGVLKKIGWEAENDVTARGKTYVADAIFAPALCESRVG